MVIFTKFTLRTKFTKFTYIHPEEGGPHDHHGEPVPSNGRSHPAGGHRPRRAARVATFLRRADKIDLHSTAIRDVEASFTKTFEASGIAIAPDLIHRAAAATGGYPFLIQLVGYFLWGEAEKHQASLSSAAVDRAIAAAIRRNERVVIEAALATVSGKDLEFLHAMAVDDGTSTAADIGQRTASGRTLVAKYRTRLLAAGIIESAGHGKVDFAIPGLRQYLRKHRS
ncbi:hypothetical protein [Pseudarthrobacter sp. H2]|uniref:hypothetical protein n=1 Tax=Pseudarthrobacter sp. H2 TaxID=3418415 RepID=UPI003CF19D98